METQRGEPMPPADAEGVAAGGVSRRWFLKKAATLLGCAVPNVILGPTLAESEPHEELHVQPGGHPEELQQGHEEPQHQPETPQHGPESDEGREKISWLNFGTALTVVGTFVRSVVLNAKYDPEQKGKGRAFGVASWSEMLAAESTRLLSLWTFGSEADKHHAKHEAAEIGKAYLLMGGLAGAAEATHHLEADEQALFDGETRLFNGIMERLDREDAEKADKALQTPDALTSSPEEWAEYYERTEQTIIDQAAQNFAIGLTVAPTLTPYTAATLGDAMNKRMAPALASNAYAKLVHEAKQCGAELSHDDLVQMTEQAVTAANERLLAYIQQTVVKNANIQAAGGIGDPPLLFLATRHGGKQWMKTSAEGLVLMNAIAAASTSAWIGNTLGWSGDSAEHMARFEKSVGEAVVNLGKGVWRSLRSTEVPRFGKLSNQLHAALEQPGLDEETANRIRDILHSMPRKPLAYDFKGFGRVFKHYYDVFAHKVLRRPNEASAASKVFEANSAAEQGQQIDMGLDMERLAEDFKRKGAISDFIKEYADKVNDNRVDFLAGAIDSFLHGDTDDLSIFMESVNSTTGQEQEAASGEQDQSEEYQQRHHRLHADLREAAKSGDEQRIKDVLRENTKHIPFLNKHTREMMIELWAREITADVVAEHPQEGGVSEGAKDLLSALATQILAADAAVVAAKKMMEMVDMPIEARTALILGITAKLSAFADNIVAYLFCENMLMSMFQQQYGEDVFERNPDFKSTVITMSFLMAVAAGALSKIGNGPIFLIQNHSLEAGDRPGQFNVKTGKMKFKDLLFKPAALAVNALTLGLAMHGLLYRHDIKSGSGSEGEPQHAGSAPQHQYAGAGARSKKPSSV